jgi:hypothetical protein
MPYEPPTGWIEDLVVDPDDKYVVHERFHTRRDCRGIRPDSELREVDRPYAAARCPFCAADT